MRSNYKLVGIWAAGLCWISLKYTVFWPSWENNFTHVKKIVFLLQQTLNFCKSNLLASLTCFITRGAEEERSEEMWCGLPQHRTPERHPGRMLIQERVWGSDDKKRARWRGKRVRNAVRLSHFTCEICSFLRLLGSDVNAHQVTLQVLALHTWTVSCLYHVMISLRSPRHWVYLHLPLHSCCPFRQPVSCRTVCLSSGDLILSLRRDGTLKEQRLSNHCFV